MFRFLLKVSLFVFVLSLPCIGAIEHYADNADYYVSTSGSDENPGSKAQPFATIEKARDALREDISKGPDKDMAVLIRGGKYEITKPLVFGPEDGGGNIFGVTYAGYPGEKVVISGGRKVTGWEKTEDGRWQCDVSEFVQKYGAFRDLYINGRRCIRARYPNDKYLRVKEAVNKTNTFEFHPGDVTESMGSHSTEIVFLHDWSIARGRIKKIDLLKNHITFEKDIALKTWWMCLGRLPDEPYYFENSKHFLDAPGEWYLQTMLKGTATLYYLPREDDEINNAEFVVPVAEGFIKVQGNADEGKFVENLHFENINFEYAAWIPPENHYLGMQACYYVTSANYEGDVDLKTTAVPAAVEFACARKCSLRGLKISHLGQTAVRFKNMSRDNLVRGCCLTDIGANGIMIGTSSGEQNINGKPWTAFKPSRAAGCNTVEHCIVEKCGQEYFGAVGLWIGLSDHNVLRNNVVRHLPYSGISVGWSWSDKKTPCHSNFIEYNHVHDVMNILSDGAGIYTLGRQDNTVIRGNLVHGVDGTKARAPNNALRWDRGGGEMLVEHNFIYDIDDDIMHFNPDTANNVIRKNIFVINTGSLLDTYRLMDPETKKVYKVEEDKVFGASELPEFIKKEKQSIVIKDNEIHRADSVPGSLLGKLAYFELVTGPQHGIFE